VATVEGAAFEEDYIDYVDKPFDNDDLDEI
jgi:hypothetical protein